MPSIPSQALSQAPVLVRALQRNREIASCDCGGWQVQNLQGRPAGWRPKELLTLQLESESHPLTEFPPQGPQSVFTSGLQLLGRGPPHCKA